MKNNRKGFTLTEILIVLVVAGILLGLILPNTLKAIERSNVAAHNSNLNSLQVALLMCYTKEKDWTKCDDTSKLSAGAYITKVPNHPFGGTYSIQKDTTTNNYVACSSNSPNAPSGETIDR